MARASGALPYSSLTCRPEPWDSAACHPLLLLLKTETLCTKPTSPQALLRLLPLARRVSLSSRGATELVTGTVCFCGAELQWVHLSLAILSPLSLYLPAGLFSFICISSLLVFLLSLLFFFHFHPYCLPAALPLFFSSRSIVNFRYLFQMYNIAIQIFVNYTSFKVITKYWCFLCCTDSPCSLSVGLPL